MLFLVRWAPLALIGVIVVAVCSAGALFLANQSPDTVRRLLPPGEYSTIEEANKAAGFEIRYPRNLGDWKLRGIEVLKFDTRRDASEEEERFRVVDLWYETEAGWNLTVLQYLNPGGAPLPASDRGAPEYIEINGNRAFIQLSVTGSSPRLLDSAQSGRTPLRVQWKDGDVDMTVQGDILAPATLTDLLPFIQSIR